MLWFCFCHFQASLTEANRRLRAEIDIKDRVIQDMRNKHDSRLLMDLSPSEISHSPKTVRRPFALPPRTSTPLRPHTPAYPYSVTTTDPLDVLVGETFNSTTCKFPLIRINRGFYRIRATELEVAQVNGKLLTRADAWNNGKFGAFSKFLTHFE